MGAGLLGAIAGLAGPMVARVLMALGFSVLTIAGAAAVVAQIKDLVLANIGAAASAGIQIAGLAGVWSALGMIFGSVTFTVVMFGLTKAVRIVGGQ